MQGLVKELALLGYLEVNHLFGIVQLVLVQTGFRLGFLVFEQGLAAMGDGNFHHDAGAEVTASPAVLEAVVDIGVGNGESAHEGHGGHEVCAYHLGFLVKDFGGQGEAAGLRAGLIDVFQALFHRAAGFRNHVQGFIGKDNGTVQRKADALAQEHLGKGEAVGGLGEHHAGLVGFHPHLEQVAFRGDACIDSGLHVFFHLFQELHIALRQFLFVGDGDNLPVGLVHVQKDIGLLHVIFGL